MKKVKKETKVAKPTGKGWLQTTKKIVVGIGNVAEVILTVPLKLPLKVLQVIKYIAVIAGIVQASDKDGNDG